MNKTVFYAVKAWVKGLIGKVERRINGVEKDVQKINKKLPNFLTRSYKTDKGINLVSQQIEKQFIYQEWKFDDEPEPESGEYHSGIVGEVLLGELGDFNVDVLDIAQITETEYIINLSIGVSEYEERYVVFFLPIPGDIPAGWYYVGVDEENPVPLSEPPTLRLYDWDSTGTIGILSDLGTLVEQKYEDVVDYQAELYTNGRGIFLESTRGMDGERSQIGVGPWGITAAAYNGESGMLFGKNGNRIFGLDGPTYDTDAANKRYVDEAASAAQDTAQEAQEAASAAQDTAQEAQEAASAAQDTALSRMAVMHDYNWTATTLPNSDQWRTVAFGGGKFVALSASSISNGAAYSTDGVSWIATTTPSNSRYYSVAYGNFIFVAISISGTVAHSTDGINWIETELPISGTWYSVCYGNGKFVAVAYNSSKAAYSTDGINWTETTLPSYGYWYSVCYGNGKFVALALSGNKAAYSTDGINWIETELPISGTWYSVCYGNGKFVAIKYSTFYDDVGEESGTAIYSTDGITWFITTLPGLNRWICVTYGDGTFVAIQEGDSFGADSNAAAYSTDGINWTAATMPSAAEWRSVCYGDGKFVAIVVNSDTAAYGAYEYFLSQDGEDVTAQVKAALGIL